MAQFNESSSSKKIKFNRGSENASNEQKSFIIIQYV